MSLTTIFEDDDYIIINKPAGALVIPDRYDTSLPSINKLLEEKLQQHIFVVHRLDRETSGVVCFAKNEQAHKHLSKLFEQHEIEKLYAGLVLGNISPNAARIDAPIIEHPFIKGKMATAKKGKPSVTDYKVSEQWPLYALVQFQIHTGRTHQIRVHMESIGHPLVCDSLYGDGKPFLVSAIKRKYKLSDKEETEKPLLDRLALHAYRLSFAKADGTVVTAEAPLPKDLMACVKQLDKWCSNTTISKK